MDAFFHFLAVLAIGFFAVIALAMVLLALPKSRFRNFVLEIMGWGTTTVSAVSIVSPVDAIPDVIPVLGQADDVGALAIGLCSAAFAWYMRRERQKLDAPK